MYKLIYNFKKKQHILLMAPNVVNHIIHFPITLISLAYQHFRFEIRKCITLEMIYILEFKLSFGFYIT